MKYVIKSCFIPIKSKYTTNSRCRPLLGPRGAGGMSGHVVCGPQGTSFHHPPAIGLPQVSDSRDASRDDDGMFNRWQKYQNYVTAISYSYFINTQYLQKTASTSPVTTTPHRKNPQQWQPTTAQQATIRPGRMADSMEQSHFLVRIHRIMSKFLRPSTTRRMRQSTKLQHASFSWLSSGPRICRRLEACRFEIRWEKFSSNWLVFFKFTKNLIKMCFFR